MENGQSWTLHMDYQLIIRSMTISFDNISHKYVAISIKLEIFYNYTHSSY